MKRTPVFVAVLCVLVCSVYAAPSLIEARKELLERQAGNVLLKQVSRMDATIQELDDKAEEQLFGFIKHGIRRIGPGIRHLLSGNSPPESEAKVNAAASAQDRMKAAKLLMPRCTSKPQELLHTEHSRASRTDSHVCTAR